MSDPNKRMKQAVGLRTWAVDVGGMDNFGFFHPPHSAVNVDLCVDPSSCFMDRSVPYHAALVERGR